MLNEFNFELPKELIAQEPASPRDSARLLVYSLDDKTITDAVFSDLPKYLKPNTTLAINRAKVDKCRMRFGSTEVFLLETVNDKTATAMVRPGRRFKLGRTVELAEGITAKVLAITDDGHRRIEFNLSLDDPAFDAHKLTPLPPYIAQNEELAEEYQTVYAQKPGSKAAPTAGLHFTDELMANIRKQHKVAEVSLDVGLGTFAALTDDNIKNKQLHSETYSMPEQAAEILNASSHVTAVGTTTTRLLESMYRQHGKFVPIESAATSIFIQPNDTIQSVDSLITNFHLPSTSLLMMVAALTGSEELMRIYDHAIKNRYRFYSFGDAMLIR